jgi:hypothetical protein
VQNLEVVLIKGIKKPIHQGGHALGSRQHSMFKSKSANSMLFIHTFRMLQNWRLVEIYFSKS